MTRVSIIFVSMLLTWGVVACASNSTPTTLPFLATQSPVPRTPTAVATSAPTRPLTVATATVQATLKTDLIEFVTALSSDDTVAVQDEVERLEGVKSAASSGQAIQITYDPAKLTLQQIITAIENYGVKVKK